MRGVKGEAGGICIWVTRSFKLGAHTWRDMMQWHAAGANKMTNVQTQENVARPCCSEMFYWDTMECVPALASCRCQCPCNMSLRVSTFRGFVCLRAWYSFNSSWFSPFWEFPTLAYQNRPRVYTLYDSAAGFSQLYAVLASRPYSIPHFSSTIIQISYTDQGALFVATD